MATSDVGPRGNACVRLGGMPGAGKGTRRGRVGTGAGVCGACLQEALDQQRQQRLVRTDDLGEGKGSHVSDAEFGQCSKARHQRLG